VITVAGCLLAAQLIGRRLGIATKLRSLIGAGTAICGASAIAAVTPVVDAEETDVGYAVATIFLFNVLAVMPFPLLGHALGLRQHSFGVFAGTAVNDLSSVVAVGGLYGSTALHTAISGTGNARLSEPVPVGWGCCSLARAKNRQTGAIIRVRVSLTTPDHGRAQRGGALGRSGRAAPGRAQADRARSGALGDGERARSRLPGRWPALTRAGRARQLTAVILSRRTPLGVFTSTT
jgi:Conserved hypothetical protein 698